MVGTFSANRGRPELAPLAGFLVNTLPIRTDLSDDPAFADLLTQVREVSVGAYAHQDLPFGKLVETIGVERDPSRAPVCQIVLTTAERDPTPVPAAGVDFVLTDLVVGINAAKFDLLFLAEARPGGLWFECSYKNGLFDAATIDRLLGHYEVLLRGAIADPGARLSELPVLTDRELRQELTEWNDTAAPFPPLRVSDLFEAQAARTPDAVAAEFEGESWSYAELNGWANRIARRLRPAGVAPEVLVGVCMRAGLALLATLLGIWKAGGAYVPLDPSLPAERLAFMMADTQMSVVVTDPASAPSIPTVSTPTGIPTVSTPTGDATDSILAGDTESPALPAPAIIWVADDWAGIAGLDAADLTDVAGAPDNAAYVLFTSGSTGRPKGVLVEHRQAVNFLHGMLGQWQIGPADAVLQFSAVTFDISVMDTFMPLLAGARLVLAAPSTLHTPPRLAALMRERRVTIACLTPAVLSLLSAEQFPDLRLLLSVGEEMPSELVRHWLRPGLTFVNDYGPTEACIGAMFMKLDADTPLPPPIGRPKPNYRGYVLDKGLRPAPAGVAGELHLGGAGVARGYLNRPELTRERFIPDPFTPGGRLYKTGDLVRRRADGTVVYLGRMDGQVKIRGLRIELGEIEAALARCPGVAQAVAVVVADQAGERQLAGYVRPAPGGPPAGIPELRDHLARLLPAYMIPVFLVLVDEFALNPSGKIDKSQLPAPQAGQPAVEQVPPRTLVETMIVDLFATVLGHQQVGAADSFFDIGGNSLQAMQLTTQVRAMLAVDLDVAMVFLAPTARQLAALLRDKHGLIDEELGAEGIDGIDGLGHLAGSAT